MLSLIAAVGVGMALALLLHLNYTKYEQDEEAYRLGKKERDK